MQAYLCIATEHGLYIYRKGVQGWEAFVQGLADHVVTSTTCQAGNVLAGTPNGIYHLDISEGNNWISRNNGLTLLHVRWLKAHPGRPGLILAGTEPAGIFVSQDGGNTWSARPEVARIRDAFKWNLPYSTRAGCVRSFAIHGQRVYAAAEVGGILYSDDYGLNWQLVEGSTGRPDQEMPFFSHLVHPDVHTIEVHPSCADRVYAATGGGLFISNDGGKAWDKVYFCYCRALWVDSSDPDHILLGTTEGVERKGRIEETRDRGRIWRMAANGLEVPWPKRMVKRFCQAGNELIAALSDGELIHSDLKDLNWQRFLPEVRGVKALEYFEIE